MPEFTAIVLTATPPTLGGGGATSGGLGRDGTGALTRVDGKEAVLRAAEMFLNREEIKQILVVFGVEELERAKKNFGHHFAFAGIKMVGGGPKWMDQVGATLEKVAGTSTHVLIHDGARCCVPYMDLDAVIEETGKATKGGVALTARVRSQMLEVDEGGGAVGAVSSGSLVQLLSPVGLTRAAFEECAKKKQEPHPSTLKLLEGSGLNIRISHAGEERLVKAMMGLMPGPVKKVDGPFGEAQW